MALLCPWLLSKCMGCEEEDPGLVMNSYKDTCPQAEDVIKEQVRLLYKLHEKPSGNGLRRSLVKLCKIGQKSLPMFQQLQALSVLVLKVVIIVRMDYGLVSRVLLLEVKDSVD